jgi:hypothetical protein
MVAGNGGLSWTTDADADLRGMPFDTVYLGGGPHGDRLSGGPGRDRLSGGADPSAAAAAPAATASTASGRLHEHPVVLALPGTDEQLSTFRRVLRIASVTHRVRMKATFAAPLNVTT